MRPVEYKGKCWCCHKVHYSASSASIKCDCGTLVRVFPSYWK